MIPESRQQQYRQEPYSNKQTSLFGPCVWYVISWALFLAAFAIYMAIYAIDTYILPANVIASYYYKTANPVSLYALTSTTSVTDSTGIISAGQLSSVYAIAMSLVFSWVLWKGPLIVFTYSLIESQEKLIIRIVSVAVTVVILLAADILLTIFLLQYYGHWIYYGLYTILTIIVAVGNAALGAGSIPQAVKSSIMPLVLIAFYYTCQCFFLPALFYLEAINQNSATTGIFGVFLWIYLYPIIDMILYGLLIICNYFLSKEKQAMRFISVIHFQLLGYSVGIILTLNYTEVEFYYLLGYFMFRNVFFNWIVWRFDKILNNPPCLPGWGIVYYISFMLNFVPIIGLGKLVISKGYYSMQFSKTLTILYGIPNTIYPYTTYADTIVNFSFIGNIFWLAGAIIWVGLTISQKYPRRKPEWKDFFYYLIGIYLFYLGVSAGLNLLMLSPNSLP